MAYRLKGFVELKNEIYRTTSTISPFGEISTQSLTYSRNKQQYISEDSTANLIVFYTQDTTGIINTPTVISNQIFQITKWVDDNQNSVNAYSDRDEFLAALTEQFNLEVSGLNCGQLIKNNNDIYFPEWIGFSKLGINGSLSYSENEIKIWYSDNSFKNQYDENEIVVIPPLSNLNDLFGSKTVVDTKLKDYRNTNLLSNIQQAKGDNPVSSILDESYLWIDPTSSTNRLNVIWTVLVYGRVADNQDSIKIAIRKYIEDNSNKIENEWKELIPDVYKNTEFIILPRWKNYAIQERQLQVGQHSPITNLLKEINYVKAKFTNYTEQFIQTNLSVIPIQYKSLNALVLGGVDNRDSLFNIAAVFPDYLNIPTSDNLFDLMSVNTKKFIQDLVKAIEAADTIGAFDNPPIGMRKITRNDILYISFKIDNIEFLVSSKATTPNY